MLCSSFCHLPLEEIKHVLLGNVGLFGIVTLEGLSTTVEMQVIWVVPVFDLGS